MKFGIVLKLNKIEKRSNIIFIINKFKVLKWLLVSFVFYLKKILKYIYCINFYFWGSWKLGLKLWYCY